jgi:hypothetical protein
MMRSRLCTLPSIPNIPTRSWTVPLPPAAGSPDLQSTPQVIRKFEPVKGAVYSVLLEPGHSLLGTALGMGVLVDEADEVDEVGDVVDVVDVLEDAGADEVTPNAPPAEGEPPADEWRDPNTPPTTPPTSASNSTATNARHNQKVVTRSLHIRLSGVHL